MKYHIRYVELLTHRKGVTGEYLAILQGRCRKNSGSLQPLYTLLHFYMVWGCRVQVRSHSFHLVTGKTFTFYFFNVSKFLKQVLHSRVRKTRFISHFLIHFHINTGKQEASSCFLLLCDHRQETGIGNRAWSRHQFSPYISHCGMFFQSKHRVLSL